MNAAKPHIEEDSSSASARFLARTDALAFAAAMAWACWRFVAICRGYWSYTVDDAYTTLRQARNLVEGYGFVYNPGGPRAVER